MLVFSPTVAVGTRMGVGEGVGEGVGVGVAVGKSVGVASGVGVPGAVVTVGEGPAAAVVVMGATADRSTVGNPPPMPLASSPALLVGRPTIAPDWLPLAGSVSAAAVAGVASARAAPAVGAAAAPGPPSGTPAAKKPIASSSSARP